MVSQSVTASLQFIFQAGKFFLKNSWTYQPQTVWTVATAFLRLRKVAGRNETLGMVTWAIKLMKWQWCFFFEMRTVQWFRLKPIGTRSAWTRRPGRETRVSHGVLASILLLTGWENNVTWVFSASLKAWQSRFICCEITFHTLLLKTILSQLKS